MYLWNQSSEGFHLLSTLSMPCGFLIGLQYLCLLFFIGTVLLREVDNQKPSLSEVSTHPAPPGCQLDYGHTLTV